MTKKERKKETKQPYRDTHTDIATTHTVEVETDIMTGYSHSHRHSAITNAQIHKSRDGANTVGIIAL